MRLSGTSLDVKLNDGATAEQATAGTVTTGAWNHVAAVFDRGSTLKLYVNGQYVGQDASIASYTLDGDGTIYLGNNATLAQPYTGYLDETRVYNVAFSSNEVNTKFLTTSNMVALGGPE